MPAGRGGRRPSVVDVRLLLRRYVHTCATTRSRASARTRPPCCRSTSCRRARLERRQRPPAQGTGRCSPPRAAGWTGDAHPRLPRQEPLRERHDGAPRRPGRRGRKRLRRRCARRMHADPRYADVCYGSVARDLDGALWLQYWFFYYNNDKTYFGYGAHEGDWEMIQLRLGADTVPTVATYAQRHSGAQAAGLEQEARPPSTPTAAGPVGRGSRVPAPGARATTPRSGPAAPTTLTALGPLRPPPAARSSATPPRGRPWRAASRCSSDTSPRGPVTSASGPPAATTTSPRRRPARGRRRPGRRPRRRRPDHRAPPWRTEPSWTTSSAPAALGRRVARPGSSSRWTGSDDDLPPPPRLPRTGRPRRRPPLALEDRSYLIRATAWTARTPSRAGWSPPPVPG